MRICYIDDNEEYLNSFKDNFKDVFCENDFTFMQYPNEYIGSDDVADIVMLDIGSAVRATDLIIWIVSRRNQVIPR